MDQSECMDSLLVAFQRMTDSFNPDMQVVVKMCILSSLLPQLFLLHSYINTVTIKLIMLYMHTSFKHSKTSLKYSSFSLQFFG